MRLNCGRQVPIPLTTHGSCLRKEFYASIVNLVAHHSYALQEAKVRGLADELLHAFPIDESLPHGLLCLCDMTTGPDGQRRDVTDPTPGMCASNAHVREKHALGDRRVQVSRNWSGKTLAEHRVDRAEVVRQVLEASGIAPPERDS
jgi:hypothetical protein